LTTYNKRFPKYLNWLTLYLPTEVSAGIFL